MHLPANLQNKHPCLLFLALISSPFSRIPSSCKKICKAKQQLHFPQYQNNNKLCVQHHKLAKNQNIPKQRVLTKRRVDKALPFKMKKKTQSSSQQTQSSISCSSASDSQHIDETVLESRRSPELLLRPTHHYVQNPLSVSQPSVTIPLSLFLQTLPNSLSYISFGTAIALVRMSLTLVYSSTVED